METDFFPLIKSFVKSCSIVLHQGGFKIFIVGCNSTLSPNATQFIKKQYCKCKIIYTLQINFTAKAPNTNITLY